MNRRYDRDEDRDLPWDPMWAYVLGEDTDERDNRDDNTRHNSADDFYDHGYGDDSRDTEDGTSGGKILKKLWKRRESVAAPTSTTTPTHSRSVDREEWSWEIDTSQFSLMGEESKRTKKKCIPNMSNDNKKTWITNSTKKLRESIGTVWRETPGQNRSILSRKSS